MMRSLATVAIAIAAVGSAVPLGQGPNSDAMNADVMALAQVEAGNAGNTDPEVVVL